MVVKRKHHAHDRAETMGGGLKMTETKDVQFVCAACNKDYEGDTNHVMTECNLCGRIHCDECVDEHGHCVECK